MADNLPIHIQPIHSDEYLIENYIFHKINTRKYDIYNENKFIVGHITIYKEKFTIGINQSNHSITLLKNDSRFKAFKNDVDFLKIAYLIIQAGSTEIINEIFN